VLTDTPNTVRGSNELLALFGGPEESGNPFYGRYASPPQTRDYRLQTLLAAVESGEMMVHTTRTDEELTGLAIWRPLSWDTEQLGIKTARVETLSASGSHDHKVHRYETLLRDVVEACKSAGVRYLTSRVDAGDVAAIHSLERFGFYLIDSIQTFSLDLNGCLPPMSADAMMCVRPFNKYDLDDVLHIARTSYVCDRFHMDPALTTEAADAIHEAWLRNSCAGIACDQVIVGVDEFGVTSYVTCNVDRAQMEATGLLVGTIAMVATAVRARGQGWALATTFGALRWFTEQGTQVVEVGTQLRNPGAASLYQKAGFRATAATFTFRKLLP
jgi:ribosomal protein S18 acetylase RimI-like enzyme